MRTQPLAARLQTLLLTSCQRGGFSWDAVILALNDELDAKFNETLFDLLDPSRLQYGPLQFTYEWHIGTTRHSGMNVPYFQHTLGMLQLALACELPKHLIYSALFKSIAQRHPTKSEEVSVEQYNFLVQKLSDSTVEPNLASVLNELSSINDFARGINMTELKLERQWKERKDSKLNYQKNLSPEPLLLEMLSKLENMRADCVDIENGGISRHWDKFHATMKAYIQYLEDCLKIYESKLGRYNFLPILVDEYKQYLEILNSYVPGKKHSEKV